MRTFFLNPVLVRETRARWRGWLSFVLVFLYAAVLALAMSWLYDTFNLERSQPVSYENGVPVEIPMGRRMAAIGHQLFLGLSLMSTLSWLLLGPALAAPAIAGERERGLLESLRLSPLPPHSVVLGKLLAVLSFLALLMLITVPVCAVSFLFGGVSPREFGLSLVIQAIAAFTGTALGLCGSAWSHNTAAALRTSYACLLGWMIVTVLLFYSLSNSRSLAITLSSPDAGPTFMTLTNPVVAVYLLLEPQALENLSAASMPLGYYVPPSRITPLLPPPPSDGIITAFNTAFGLILSFLLLVLAAVGLRRAEQPAQFVERRHWLEKLKSLVPPPADAPDGSTTRTAPTQAVPETSPPETPLKAEAGSARSSGFRRVLWNEFSIVPSFHFANPVLQHEMQSRLRLRAPNWRSLLVRITIGALLANFYLQTLADVIYNPYTRQQTWWSTCTWMITGSMLAAAIMGATSFTRERERAIWLQLRLSLLTPQQLLAGKLGAPLLTCGFYSLPLWLILLPCIGATGSTHAYSSVSWNHAGATMLLFVAATWCSVTWGLVFSWLCRRTVAAVGWTLALHAFLFVACPLALGFLSSSGSGLSRLYYSLYHTQVDALRPIHPLLALAFIQPARFSYELNNWQTPFQAALETAVPLGALGCTLLFLVYSALRADIREADETAHVGTSWRPARRGAAVELP